MNYAIKCDGCGRLDSLEYAYDKEMGRSYRYSVLDISTCKYCEGEFCVECFDGHLCTNDLPATTEREPAANVRHGDTRPGQSAA